MRTIIAATCFLLAIAPAASAQSCNFRLNADIPLRYNAQAGALLVDAKVGGQPIPLIVSTSSPMTTLGRATVDRLKLETHYDSRYRTRGPSNGDVRFLQVTLPDFTLGQHRLGSPEVFVQEGTSDGAMPTTGRLGLNILYDYDIEFDVKGGRLNLYESVPCAHTAPWSGDVETVPLNHTRKGQRVLFDVTVNGRKMRAELDSGAPRTMMTLRGARRLGLSADGMPPGPDLLGVDGKIRATKLHQFESFAIEGEEIRNPRLPIIEFLKYPGSIAFDGDIEVYVGADWLRAHHVYIARGTHEMHFAYVGGPVFEK
ncbi:retroviral-like aspartic protease family protein [Roseiterribacter gracilis]|uniref:Peptidase A2 domain-containing protein n=1 Tax=Roseiterribacter gracilis TaxID=2812848 RepID=A0A8S8XJV7_9PROT|nr:hypothetical protein TMPK1_33170 [Rhodospirillales bacterium TMPK1]